MTKAQRQHAGKKAIQKSVDTPREFHAKKPLVYINYIN
jgi:hypothetical protein